MEEVGFWINGQRMNE